MMPIKAMLLGGVVTVKVRRPLTYAHGPLVRSLLCSQYSNRYLHIMISIAGILWMATANSLPVNLNYTEAKQWLLILLTFSTYQNFNQKMCCAITISDIRIVWNRIRIKHAYLTSTRDILSANYDKESDCIARFSTPGVCISKSNLKVLDLNIIFASEYINGSGGREQKRDAQQ